MEFKDKVKNARLALNISQAELARRTGISNRTIVSYEQGVKPKRGKNIRALAEVLHVSTEYLMNDEVTDTQANIESEVFLDKVSDTFGTKAKKEAEEVLEKATALFAGGDLDDDAKEVFMQSLMEVYMESKKDAKKKYGTRMKKTKKSY
ncbi:MAG: helix-turn-helix transcriptional regulator [Eubacterium sp.]|nr:helix-turn-helix transcriptional regulator [Eubacterium sp.]